MEREVTWDPIRLLLGLLLWGAAVCENCLSPNLPAHVTKDDLALRPSEAGLFYQCFVAQNNQLAQFKINNLQLSNGTGTLIWADGIPHEFYSSCRQCSQQSLDNGTCKKCQNPTTKVSAMLLEIYLRTPVGCFEDEKCKDSQNFNVTIYQNDLPEVISKCDEGFLEILQPVQDLCVVDSLSSNETSICVKPKCDSNIIALNTSNEKIEHIIHPSEEPYQCVWSINTESGRYIQLTFTPEVKSYITVYEGNLTNPKWDVEWCPDYRNEVVFKTTFDTVFVVVDSKLGIKIKNSLTFMTHVDFCSLPPLVENGKVEFKKLESGTIALYNCDEEFILSGPNQTFCHDKIWEDPPLCLLLEESKSKEDLQNPDYESSTDETIDSEIANFDEQMNFPDFGMNNTYNFSMWDFPFNASDHKGNLFYFINLNDKHTLYILIGLGSTTAFLVLATIACICYQWKHPTRIRLGQKFDTFQNPIYEKAVIVPVEVDMDMEKTKGDIEDLSDSTILE